MRRMLLPVLPAAAAALPQQQQQQGPSFALSYGSHMVLQQAPARAAVWGFAHSSDPVTVTLAGGGRAVDASATVAAFNDTTFTWRALLPPTAAQKSASGDAVRYNVSAQQGAAAATIDDVLFGEVWVCSGQSNMAFLVEMAFGGAALVQDANNHPDIRLFTTRKLTAGNPLRELGQDTNKGTWTRGVELPWARASNISISDNNRLHGAVPQVSVSDDNWLYMSAVCYLFGKQIHEARGVPVGLMNTNWGGTAIQDWCPAAALSDCKHARGAGGDEAGGEAGVGAPRVATHLFNAMISPLTNHTIKGAVWYQGESNGGQPVEYSCLLPALVKRWRESWASGSVTDPQFPFGVVQLAGNVGGDPLALPKFRWIGQTQGTGTLPNDKIPHSFLAAAHDLGDSTSPYGAVHCRYKKEVAQRLALGARRIAYGEDVHSGPVLDSASASRAGSASVLLRFRDVGSAGLVVGAMNISQKFNQTRWYGRTPFEVCTLPPPPPNATDDPCGAMGGFDGWAPPAAAAVGGAAKDTVTLSGLGAGAGAPRAVRYAWRGYPCEHLGCGLYSAEGLPPPPFHAML